MELKDLFVVYESYYPKQEEKEPEINTIDEKWKNFLSNIGQLGGKGIGASGGAPGGTIGGIGSIGESIDSSTGGGIGEGDPLAEGAGPEGYAKSREKQSSPYGKKLSETDYTETLDRIKKVTEEFNKKSVEESEDPNEDTKNRIKRAKDDATEGGASKDQEIDENQDKQNKEEEGPDHSSFGKFPGLYQEMPGITDIPPYYETKITDIELGPEASFRHKLMRYLNTYAPDERLLDQDINILCKIAELESNFDFTEENGNAYGAFQFMPGTLQYHGYTKEDLIDNPDVQFEVAIKHYKHLKARLANTCSWDDVTHTGVKLTPAQIMYGMWWRPASMERYIKTGKDSYVAPDKMTIYKALKKAR